MADFQNHRLPTDSADEAQCDWDLFQRIGDPIRVSPNLLEYSHDSAHHHARKPPAVSRHRRVVRRNLPGGDLGLGRLYEIEASSGEARSDFREFFKKVWKGGRSFTIRENEVLQRPFTNNDPLGITDTFSVNTGAAGIAVVDIDAIDFSEVG